ncbi:MAG TPA: lipocalin family protein [Pedobacter sp.]
MKKNALFIVFMIAILCIASCKKKFGTIDDQQPGALLGKNWKLTAYTMDGIDSYDATYDDCEQDNIQTFLANGTYKVDEGPLKCNEDDPQLYDAGSWEIKNNTITFSEEGFALQLKATILTLSAKTLKYSLKNPLGTETLVYTYTAQ